MLIDEYVEMRWNARNIKHYSGLGYQFTKPGDRFVVKPYDLPKFSQTLVRVRCDYCGREFTTKWSVYFKGQRSGVNKDCCNSPKCTGEKSADATEAKYGVRYSSYLQSAIDKRKETCLKKYGVENPFASEEVKRKIAETNLARYGFGCCQQNSDVRAKTESTCLAKYGVKNYVELFAGQFIGENSPVWRGGPSASRVERATHSYNLWRKSVFERDRYTCRKCGAKSERGHHITLNAHHIMNWADNVDVRYDISNGITLCSACHNEFHSIYGKRNNTYDHLKEFLADKKIC